MIDQNFRESFKKHLGEAFSYTPHVKKLLAEENETNRNGKPFSSQSIRNVFNGLQEELIVEDAIIRVYHKFLQKKANVAKAVSEVA